MRCQIILFVIVVIDVVMCKKKKRSFPQSCENTLQHYVSYQTFSFDREENFNITKDGNQGKQSEHGVRCDRLLPFKSLTEVDP